LHNPFLFIPPEPRDGASQSPGQSVSLHPILRITLPNPARFRRLAALSLAVAIAAALASCASRQPAQPPAPEPYTRIHYPDTNTVQLQIALRKFVPAHGHGPTLWLAAVCHIGDRDYYHALQRQLDAQTLVLFEGVNAEAHPRRVHPAPAADANAYESTRPPRRAEPPGLQTSLAESLGLVFQLDAIDYDRTNFLNSDLSIEEIARLVNGVGGPVSPGQGHAGPGNQSFQYLLQVMDGSSFLGSLARFAVGYLGSNPQMRAVTRFAFIEAIGRLQGDLAGARGMPPDMQRLIQVLIQARNQAVINDFVEEARTIPRSGSIAIFYGIGHMDDLEQRVVRQLRYRPAGDLWLTAFSVDLRDTGLTPAQIENMRGLVKWEMDQLQGGGQ
jgi:hypothetical protein